MRRRAATATCLALLVAAAAHVGAADDAKPAPAKPWTCTRPELPPLPAQPSARDLHDQGLRARLREIGCEIDARRRLEPGGAESCYFGPEYVRITNQRYEEIREKHKSDPVELWHALLKEPEDPNLPPIEIRVMSKSGPSCKNDYDRKLEAEEEAIQKELNFR